MEEKSVKSSITDSIISNNGNTDSIPMPDMYTDTERSDISISGSSQILHKLIFRGESLSWSGSEE